MRLIEIITHHVEMPDMEQRRYQKNPLDCNGNKWEVVDTETGKRVAKRTGYENASLICHNLNKKFYERIL